VPNVSPLVKYSLARLGLFVMVAAVAVVIPIELSLLLRLAIAVLVSAVLSYFLLRRLRDQVANQLGDVAQRRAERKDRLRAALAGEDTDDGRGGEVTPPTS
jgi:membrane protein implicated in regulation of membrane protease activity